MYYDIGNLRKYNELEGKTFLICVGAAKCATSWIYHYLGSLPGIAVSPLKELHFFSSKFSANALGDMDLLALKRVGFYLESEGNPVENLQCSQSFQASVDRMQMVYDDDAYFNHFARLCSLETRTLCDITPGYSVIGPDGFKYMKAFCSRQDVKLKLVYVMRDPVDRLWSQLRHLQEISPEKQAAARWAEAIQSLQICARADYRGTISDIDAAVSSDDILYLFYEDLFTESSLRKLCNFADVGYLPGETHERKNRTEVDLELPDDACAAFLQMLAPQYDFCRERFGNQVPANWAG